MKTLILIFDLVAVVGAYLVAVVGAYLVGLGAGTLICHLCR